MVGRREAEGRCLEDTEAVRDIGLGRGLLALDGCRCSPMVGRRGLVEGLP
jgi:hypothetical protein